MSNRDDDQMHRENKDWDEKDRLAAQERQNELDRTRSPEAMMAASGYPPTSTSAPPSRLRPSLSEEVSVEIRRVHSCLSRISYKHVGAINRIRDILWRIEREPIGVKEELERALSVLEDEQPSDPGVKHLKEAIRIYEC